MNPMQHLLMALILTGFPALVWPDEHEKPLTEKLMAVKTQDIDYNYTLHSKYLKYKVFQTADIIANASLFAATGWIRDHRKRAYIHLGHPVSKVLVAKQSRKLKKMGFALKRTNDDDYRLAGDILIQLSKTIHANPGEAKRQVLLLEEFYREDLERPAVAESKDQGQLQGMANEVLGCIRETVGQCTKALQEQALNALNLQNVLGGMFSVFQQ